LEGVYGVQPQIRLSSHNDHSPENGRGIGVKNCLHSRQEQVLASLEGDKDALKRLYALAGIRVGGRKTRKKRVYDKITPKKVDTAFVGAFVRAGKITFSEGWIRLANPKERDEILQAIEVVGKMGDELRATLGSPVGPQVMGAPIKVGYIPE